MRIRSKKVRFASMDGLLVTADLYAAARPKGFVLLCHRSHFNRGEYHEIAPKLAALGFTCLAIDQRSGMEVLGVKNETAARAKRRGLPTGYGDARPDIEAGIGWLRRKSRRPIILFGSSYSASLALLIGKENAAVGAVAAFSPGEYLKGVDVAKSLAGFSKPVWLASSKKEIAQVTALARRIPSKWKTQFRPRSEGAHGARVLWEKTEGHEAYWKSLRSFLSRWA